MARVNPVIEQRVARAVRALAPHMQVCAAYIFGSHVDGTPDTYSDIDLAVFVQGAETWDIFRRADITALVQREAGDDIELHYFPAQALQTPDSASFAAYVLRQGIPITGTAGQGRRDIR